MLDRLPRAVLTSSSKKLLCWSKCFVKDPKKTIDSYLKEQNKDLTCVGFKRVTLNEE